MRKIETEIKYKAEHFKSAYQLHYSVNFKWFQILFYLSTIGFTVFTIFFLMNKAWWLALMMFAYLLAVVLFRNYRMNTYGIRVFKKMKAFHKNYQVSINEKGFIFHDGEADSKTSFSKISKALVTTAVILLYTEKYKFFIFPREVFEPDDFSAFKSIIKQKVHFVQELDKKKRLKTTKP